MDNKGKKVIIGAGTAVAAAAGASYAAAKFFLKTAVNREKPPLYDKVKDALSGNMESGLIESGVDRLVDEFKELEGTMEKVTILSDDGLELVGHLRRAPREKRIILAMHGWRSTWYKDFAGGNRFWYDNGCTVLYVEQRSQNGSQGDYMGFGITERYDCVKWANWIAERNTKNLPVYLAGISMGASTVLMASDLALPGCVKGIMADCGYTSADDIWRHVANDNLHMGYGVIGTVARDIAKRKLDLDVKNVTTIDSLRRTRLPVLLIHGTSDRFVPVSMTYLNYAACSGPKRMLIVPGADHGMSFLVARRAYEDTVLKFFRDFDKYDETQVA